MKQEDIIIAIDGHSSCGKSTIAKDLARELKYNYIDTGAMYRCVTLFVIENSLVVNGQLKVKELEESLPGIDIQFKYNEETAHSDIYLNGTNVEEEIRKPYVANLVSHVSALSFVRRKLVDLQRQMGTQKGIVMDGRDIGTVVFPDAELKFFVTAEADIRAKRRYKELKEKGIDISLEQVKKNVLERDKIDTSREDSPLRKADDAIIIDNSYLNRKGQFECALEHIESYKKGSVIPDK